MCQITLFGAPSLLCDRGPLHIPRRKGWALLAYLALTGQKHTRETLASLFWPEYEEGEGRADLSRILSTLRKTMGSGYFLADRETIALNLDGGAALWVDVVHFRRLLHACRQLAAAESEDGCRQKLEEAVALYRGDFLAGFTLPDCPEFDEWQRQQTESLRRDLGWALERLGYLHEAAGELRQAIDYAQRWVNLDPLHEPAQRRLMALYARNGQRAAAYRQYQSCQRLLAEELGVEPQIETKQLYEQIQAGKIAPWQPAIRESAALPEWIAPSSEARFVGRQQELARLESYLEQALQGEGRVVFITGGAGRGKSSLLQAFARQAQERHPELVVTGGACSAISGAGDPYAPFRDAMALLCGEFNTRHSGGQLTAEQARRLQALLPETAQAILAHGPQLLDTFVSGKRLLVRAAAVTPAGAEWLVALQDELARQCRAPEALEKTALFGQFSNVLHVLAQRRPLLITLDDLQWIDEASSGLLFHLGRQLAGSRILIIGAFRPDELEAEHNGEAHPLRQIVDELQRRFGEIFIDLAQADRNSGRAFIDALVDTEANRLDGTFRQALFQQTGGHPLFVVELLREMQSRGTLVQDSSGRWVAADELDWETLPARVEAVIARRVDRLEPKLREILDVASVAGERFHPEVIAQVLRFDERDVLRTLSQELQRQHRLVREQGDVAAGSRPLSLYQFSHALFQQYLYNQLSQGERRYWHGAVGAALERLYATDADQIAGQLAHHFMSAAEWDSAVPYLTHVADLAYQKASLPDAARYFQTALAHWPANDPLGQALTLRKLGECLWPLQQHDGAIEALQASYELFVRHGKKQEAAIAQQLLGRVHWEAGRLNQAGACYRHALALVEGEPESEALAWALAGLSSYHMHLSDYETSISLGERALALARRLGVDALVIRCLCDVGSALSGMGDWAGVAMERESLERALALNRPHDAGRAYLYIAEALGYLGQYGEAEKLLQEAMVYARRMHIPYIAETASREVARLEWMTGRWGFALARLQEMESRPKEERPAGLTRFYQTITLGQLYNDLGRADHAGQRLAQADLGAVDSLDPRVAYLGELARAQMASGGAAQAAPVIAEIMEWCDQAEHLFPNVGMALLFICRLPVAHSSPAIAGYARSACQQLQRLDRQYRTPVTAAWQLEGRGWLNLAEVQLAEAGAHFEQAAAEWQKLGQPYDQARALSGLSQALSRAGDGDGARLVSEQAMALIHDLAAQLEEPRLKVSFLESELVQQIRAIGNDPQGRQASSAP